MMMTITMRLTCVPSLVTNIHVPVTIDQSINLFDGLDGSVGDDVDQHTCSLLVLREGAERHKEPKHHHPLSMVAH